MLENNKSLKVGKIIKYFLVCLVLCLLALLWHRYTSFVYEVYERNPVADKYPEFEGRNFSDVLRKGEYLAKLGNCISCHTDKTPGSQPFSGGLMISTPFGKVPSTNITPDLETGIGLWTRDNFVKAMKHGISPTGKNYYPAFPYVYFSNLTDSDLNDLFYYFKNVPAVKKQNKSPTAPLNIWGVRKLVSIWNLFAFKRKPKLLEASQPLLNKVGAYIVNGLGHCGMCHTGNNIFGLPKIKYYLSGAFVAGFWAPNINKLGLSNVSETELVSVFKKGLLMNNAGPLAGPMADVSHNSLQFLLLADAKAIASYLKSIEAEPTLKIYPVVTERTPPSLKRGQKVYAHVCFVCHQTGMVSAPKIGHSATWFNRLNDAGIDTLYQRTINGFNNMPKLGGCVNCTDNDIISAVNYMLRDSLTQSHMQQARTVEK